MRLNSSILIFVTVLLFSCNSGVNTKDKSDDLKILQGTWEKLFLHGDGIKVKMEINDQIINYYHRYYNNNKLISETHYVLYFEIGKIIKDDIKEINLTVGKVELTAYTPESVEGWKKASHWYSNLIIDVPLDISITSFDTTRGSSGYYAFRMEKGNNYTLYTNLKGQSNDKRNEDIDTYDRFYKIK